MALDQLPVLQVPYLVVDVETTGLVADRDRVVEVAAVLVAPGEEPRVLLDSVVDPEGPIGASDIHGLKPADVAGAPKFRDLAEALHSMMANRVVVAHHAAFDLRFLLAEMQWHADVFEPPSLCTLELMARLDHGHRHRLADACRLLEIDAEPDHSALADALATAHLLRRLLRVARQEHQVRRLGDLSTLCPSLANGLDCPPVSTPSALVASATIPARPRRQKTRRKVPPQVQYLESLLTVLADLEIDDDELERIRADRERLRIDDETVRALHARIYATALQRFAEDRRLDAGERRHLQRLHECLRTLGWAPGD